MKVLPVCSYCGKVRDDLDHWHRANPPLIGDKEQVSATICPDCYIKNFGPEFHEIPIPDLNDKPGQIQPPI